MRIELAAFAAMCCLSLFAGLLMVQPVLAGTIPQFVTRDVPPHQYTGGWHHFVGGGVAAFDCSGDGFPELVVAGGESPAQLLRNRTEKRGGALVFSADTPAAVARTGVTGVYPVDIDSDGLDDLVLLRVGQDVLLRGSGNCAFEPFATELGFQSPDLWSTAFSATFEEGQVLPTLAFGTYVDRAHPDGPFGQCSDTLLYRPNGKVYHPVETLSPGFCALSMLFTDWSRSGRADLRVSNDRHYFVRGGAEQLWAMTPEPRLYSEEEGWLEYQLWGMGIASRDLNGDGHNDVMLTSMGDQKLQYFDPTSGGPVYRNAPYDQGASAHRPYTGGDGRPSTGWHAAFGDVQNDGLDDLFIAKGNVDQMPDAAVDDPNNLLVQGVDGHFTERGMEAGVASLARSRGAALVDLNQDGRLDLAVVNRRAPLELYENRTVSGAWISVALSQPGVNPGAIGAFVEVRDGARTWTREVTIGGGHAGGDSVPLHMGLGAASDVELRVVWPDQQVSDWLQLETNQSVQIQRSGAELTLVRR